MQRIAEVRALCERVRRPAVMFVVGLVLVLLAGALVLRTREQTRGRGDAATRRALAVDAGRVRSQRARVLVNAERARRAREARLEVLKLAREFDVPVGLAEQIHTTAVREGVEPRVAFGLVRTESSFRRSVVSYAGAVGYTQVLPSTAGWLVPGTSRSALFQTETNLTVGFRYLRYLQGKYRGNLRLALTAYNRGPGTVDRLLRRGRNPENGYATKVLRKS